MSIIVDKEKLKQYLYSVVSDYKIFIDSCSLMFTEAEAFWDNIIPILKKKQKTVIVPLRVYEEVSKFAKNPNLCDKKGDCNLHSKAVAAKKKIVGLQSEGLVEVFGDDDDFFADNVLQVVFTKFRMKYNLLLITQDLKLSQDIIDIGKSLSVKAKRLRVARINESGFLREYYETSDGK